MVMVIHLHVLTKYRTFTYGNASPRSQSTIVVEKTVIANKYPPRRLINKVKPERKEQFIGIVNRLP